ncbi:MAG: serine/threonine protein kinase [Candidatus Obscuribacterales bacterium]|nr:serine/threonine protein kinase [Candidatus Obscuribacterales bacterium]
MVTRTGSLTQWIFRPDSCKCEQPVAKEITTKIPALATEFAEKWDDELPLGSEKFPISRYAPKALLGTGGSGIVYLARDRILRKKVAVKLLNQLTGSQLILFQDEARSTSKLSHKNIIQILDFGPTENGTPYMVLEYVPNATTLEELIKTSGALAFEYALEVFIKVCEGLEHAHHMGVFHRDIKPSNILVAPGQAGEKTVKLIDFGVAKYIDFLDPSQPQATTIAGTPAYMAPEQIRNEPYDARSEIYSLGCVFFETLTGHPPFVAATALETMALHAKHYQDSIDWRNSNILLPRKTRAALAGSK